jgi:hypothetical protein
MNGNTLTPALKQNRILYIHLLICANIFQFKKYKSFPRDVIHHVFNLFFVITQQTDFAGSFQA